MQRGPLIANIGLTAWGRSGIRNFMGFAAVGLHRFTGHPTKVIVHHAIEVFDPAETGYGVSSIVMTGAHLALNRIRKCELIVFSPRLLDTLTQDYNASHVRLMPLPGRKTRRLSTPPGQIRPKIVSAGYWAPYKGIDTFIQVAARLRSRADFVLAGRTHLGLSASEEFQHRVDIWRTRALEAGVRLPGFLSATELDSEFKGPTVGVLPYTSVSGASASFQLFAERGVPVVASDLPEFRYLRDCGAGVLLAPPSVEKTAAAIECVIGDRDLWNELASRQETFNARYSWDNFVRILLEN